MNSIYNDQIFILPSDHQVLFVCSFQVSHSLPRPSSPVSSSFNSQSYPLIVFSPFQTGRYLLSTLWTCGLVRPKDVQVCAQGL